MMTLPSMSPRFAAFAVALSAVAASAPALAHPHVWVGTQTRIIFENGALSALRYTWLFDEMYTANAVEGLDTNKNGTFEPAELEELTKVNIEGLKEFDYFTAATMAGEALQFGDAKDYKMEVMEVDEAPGPQMVAGPAPPATNAPTAERRGLWSRFTGWVAGLFGSARTAPANDAAKPAAPPEKTKVLALHLTLPFKAPLPASRMGAGAKGFQFSLNDAQMFIWFEPTAKDGLALAPGAPAGCRATFVEPEMDEQQKKLQEAFGRLGSSAISGPGKTVAVVCAKP